MAQPSSALGTTFDGSIDGQHSFTCPDVRQVFLLIANYTSHLTKRISCLRSHSIPLSTFTSLLLFRPRTKLGLHGLRSQDQTANRLLPPMQFNQFLVKRLLGVLVVSRVPPSLCLLQVLPVPACRRLRRVLPPLIVSLLPRQLSRLRLLL